MEDAVASPVSDGGGYCTEDVSFCAHEDRAVPGSSTPRKAGILYVYAVGGRNRGKTVAVVERFSVEEEKWERCPSLLVSRGSHGVCSEGGKVYAVAGGGINSNLTSCEAYDGSAGCWKHIQPLSTARHALAAASGGGKVYAVGGWVDGNHCTGETECYDVDSGTWKMCSPLKVPRRLHGVAELHGRVYAFGGVGADSEFQTLKDAECYNSIENAWTSIAPLPQPGYTSCCALAPHVYVFVWGQGVWRYSPERDVYEHLADLPLPEWYGFAVASSPEGVIYAVGGSTVGSWTGAAFALDVATAKWRALPGMKVVRRRCGAAVCIHEVEDTVEAPSPTVNYPVLPDSAVKRRTARVSKHTEPLRMKSFEKGELGASEINMGSGSRVELDRAITGEAFDAMPVRGKREWHEHIAMAIGGWMHAIQTRICQDHNLQRRDSAG